MIRTITHLADLHIRKTPTRNEEYESVFTELIKSLSEKKPDRIVIVGDLVHDYLDLQGEQLILVHNLLNDLSKIAPVRITRGNHDCKRFSTKRIDSVKAIVETLKNSNVVYYDKTGLYVDDNVVWAVWHHGEQKNNPWKLKENKVLDLNNKISIDLFHDPINGCITTSGFEMKSKSFYKSSDFSGSFSFLGDIHKQQFLDKEETKAYSGSLISQDFSEGDDNFHGYILWDIENKKHELVSINNEFSYKNIKITPFVDFDDLDFEIENPTKFMKVRFVWNTLPQTRTKESERKLSAYLNSKYSNVVISNKNDFIENDKIEVNENITLQNITNKAVQHELFKEYLEKIGVNEKIINDIILLDEEIMSNIGDIDESSVEWGVVKFGCKNFMSYNEFDIDWREMDGLYQISGENTAGKTTILKSISYILFGKTLETETRMKYGDMRFVNNRNDSKSCEAYLVLEANGEFYGIRKRTEITKSRDGQINGAPTTVNYYLLNNPDDEMNENTSVDNLDEDRKVKTQKKIETIIGSYDNFMRVVMTTSDTLNRVLSNDMAVFIDSILFDSGLDIFDIKLEEWKNINKRINEKSRITCNVELKENENLELLREIGTVNDEISVVETENIPNVQGRIKKGREYVESLNQKLYKIDSEIYNLNIKDVKETISTHNKNIGEFNNRKSVIVNNISPLKETYDEKKLIDLNEKKDVHKSSEYNKNLIIKTIEQEINNESHQIEIINGDIFRLKQDNEKNEDEINGLKNSKTCPTCGQPLTEEHQQHIDSKIKTKSDLITNNNNIISTKEQNDKVLIQKNIEGKKIKIELIRKEIQADSISFESLLKEIGNLTNDKNDVEKRRELQNELDQIPTKIQNEELKIKLLQQKIDNYENSLKQIEENKTTEKTIDLAKDKIILLETEENNYKLDVYNKKTLVTTKQVKIKENEQLMIDFKAQEYRDNVMNLYKKCVHRDGIPRQMLSNYIISKINLTMENILTNIPFKIWLDQDDLRPKLAYINRPNSIIDCISASGKERTFASVVLKFALNQINVKSKPTIFLLDEVMGKLSEDSVEEFIEIIKTIKNNMKKTLVIEHRVNIEPDYLIEVEADENGISTLKIV